MWKRHGSDSGQGPPVGASPHFSRLNLSFFYVSTGLSLLHFLYETCPIMCFILHIFLTNIRL